MGGVIFVDRVLMMLVEYDVVVMNGHVRVAVGTLVRVSEAQSVPNLVDDAPQVVVVVAKPHVKLDPFPVPGRPHIAGVVLVQANGDRRMIARGAAHKGEAASELIDL